MKILDYFFYKFYKISENAPSRWMSEWKAMTCVILIVFYCLFLIGLYYSIFFKRIVFQNANEVSIGIFSFVAVLGGYYYFIRKNRWIQVIAFYDSANQQLKKRRSIFFTIFIVLLIAALFFGFYLLSIKNI